MMKKKASTTQSRTRRPLEPAVGRATPRRRLHASPTPARWQSKPTGGFDAALTGATLVLYVGFAIELAVIIVVAASQAWQAGAIHAVVLPAGWLAASAALMLLELAAGGLVGWCLPSLIDRLPLTFLELMTLFGFSFVAVGGVLTAIGVMPAAH